MGTAQAAYEWAKRWAGWKEDPQKPRNASPFGDYTGYPNQPYCGSFVKMTLEKTGTWGEPSPVWTPAGANAYKRSGRWVGRYGQVPFMSLVFFDWGGSTNPDRTDHVGFYLGHVNPGRIRTLEANTSPTDRGSQSNGDGVYFRERNLTTVVGFGVPNYTPVSLPAPPVTPPSTVRPPTPPTLSTEEDEVTSIIVTPTGKHWLCSGAWRTEITPQDSDAWAFVGVRRTPANAEFTMLVERSLKDTAAVGIAAWNSELIKQKVGA